MKIRRSWLLFPFSGQVLNRFSKDIGFMDDLLPATFFEAVQVSIASRNRSEIILKMQLFYVRRDVFLGKKSIVKGMSDIEC